MKSKISILVVSFLLGVDCCAQLSQYKQVNTCYVLAGVYFVKMMWGAEEVSYKVIKEKCYLRLSWFQRMRTD